MLKRNQKSIGFPLLGTGVLKYPANLVAKEMIETCVDILTNESNITINIVLFNEDHDVLKVL
jgi:O-acetyl-ADP-ribose deacetylase (regulator of RNase III)